MEVVLGPWAQVGSFLVVTLVALAACLNRISTMDKALLALIVEGDRKVSTEAGESDAAIRQKIVDVELWGRDNYVRRDEYKSAMEQLNRNVENLRAYIEGANKDRDEKFERFRGELSAKLDKLIEARG